MYSLPYSSINMWWTEITGTLDFNAEIELWTRAHDIIRILRTRRQHW